MDTLNRLWLWGRTHVLITILTFAAVLRLSALNLVPPSLNWDEVSMGYSAYSILKTGRDEWGEFLPLLFRSYGEWKSPVYIYLLVPFIQIFGLNAWGVRLPAALAGIVAVYLTYLIGRRLYSEKVGLWTAFLLAVSPWHLMLSRPAFEAGLSLALVLLGIHTWLKFSDNSKSSHVQYSIYSSLAFGLALHTYHSAKIVVPLVFVYLLASLWQKASRRYLIIATLILTIFILPIATDFVSGRSQKRFAQVGLTTDAELVERFFRYRNTFPLGDIGNKAIFNKYTFILAKGFSNWTSYLSPHFLLGSESIRAQHSLPFRGVLYFTEFTLMCVGAWILFKRYQGPARYLPLLMIGVGFIPPALTKDIYHVLRSILTLPWWQLLASLGLVELSNNKFKYLRFIILVLGFEIVSFLLIYFFWYPRAFARDWQYGTKELATWLAENGSKYKHIYMTKAYGEPQLFLAFYNKWDPTWYQQENVKLIGYEALGYPWLDQLPQYSLGKYTFRDINWPQDNGRNEMLFIGKGDDFWLDTPYVFRLDFPDGTAAFRAAEGK